MTTPLDKGLRFALKGLHFLSTYESQVLTFSRPYIEPWNLKNFYCLPIPLLEQSPTTQYVGMTVDDEY